MNCQWSAVRRFYEYLRHHHRPGLVHPVRRRDFRNEPRPWPRAASEGHLVNFWAEIHSARDRALSLVFLRGGVRASEVVGLDVRDVDLRQQTLRVREGKHRRERLVDLSPDTVRVLAEYLEQRGRPMAGKLFGSDNGRTQGQSLSRRGVQKRIEGDARRAGVRVSCHLLRHSLATQRLNQGVRLVVVQEWLGHSSVTSPQRYARLANRRVREEDVAGLRKIFGVTI